MEENTSGHIHDDHTSYSSPPVFSQDSATTDLPPLSTNDLLDLRPITQTNRSASDNPEYDLRSNSQINQSAPVNQQYDIRSNTQTDQPEPDDPVFQKTPWIKKYAYGFVGLVIVSCVFIIMHYVAQRSVLDNFHIDFTKETTDQTASQSSYDQSVAAQFSPGHGTDWRSRSVIDDMIARITVDKGYSEQQVAEEMISLYLIYDSENGMNWQYSMKSDRNGYYSCSDTDFDIQDLSKFPNLEYLFLPDVNIHPGDLDDLKRLHGLECSNTPEEIASILPPDQLEFVGIHDPQNKMTSLNGLEKFSNLTGFAVASDSLTDLSALENRTQIVTLDLNVPNYTGDFDFLFNYKGLNTLAITNDHVTDLYFLRCALFLHTLTIERAYQNSVPLSIERLDTCYPLRELYIRNCKIEQESLSILSHLPQLEVLQLDRCGLTDSSFLNGCDFLTMVMLNDNQLSDLNGVTSLSDLYRLEISNNQISDLTPLAIFKDLRVLNCSGCPLSSSELDDLRTAIPDLTIITYENSNS